MGDQPHIIELIDQLLGETADNPKLQEKILICEMHYFRLNRYHSNML